MPRHDRCRPAIEARRPLGLSPAAARFAADLGERCRADGRIGLAVSGGPDSLALLLLADEAIPGRFEVATVDHRLRPASDREAAMVAGLSADRAIPHRTLAVTVAATGNRQAKAREARYAALAGWACERALTMVATAHHLDDQAETLLMRLVRGAGVRGLAAMRARAAFPGATGLLLARPLLTWRRAELAAVVADACVVPALDPSNADQAYARVALRRRLASAPWLPPEQLAASAAHLGDADDALAWAAAREFAEQVQTHPQGWTYRPHGPRALRLRVLERLVAPKPCDPRPRGADLARLLAALEAGRSGTLAGTKASVASDGSWRFSAAPPHRR